MVRAIFLLSLGILPSKCGLYRYHLATKRHRSACYETKLPNTKASDIFALGSTLYKLVAGKDLYSELSGAKSDDPDMIKVQIRRKCMVDHEIETLTIFLMSLIRRRNHIRLLERRNSHCPGGT